MTFVRSLLIALLAVAVAKPVGTLLADPRPRWRHFAWALLLAPYLTPTLLIGYAYANYSLSLVRHPELNTVFYAILVWLKLTPIAALVLHFTPPPISDESVHCHRLLVATGWDRFVFWFEAGRWRGSIVAVALVFLFAFAEFELASLMYVKSWTVTLFDAHVGGLALGESLRRMLGPLVIEMAALFIAVAVLSSHRVVPARRAVKRSVIGWIYLGAAFLAVLTVPAGMMLRGTVQGLTGMLENFALGRELAASLLLAAGTTWTVTVVAASCRGRSPWQRCVAGTLCGLGLLGPLVLSLAVLAAVQGSWLRSIRDTPIPLIVTLTLVLLPVAFVLRLLLDSTKEGTALHLVSLMERSRAAGEIIWRLKTSGRFWTVFLLFGWAYWDLTASAILAPIAMTPVTVRLYNLMHYGRMAALSAMLFVTFAAPLLVGSLVVGTRRWWVRG